MAANIRVAQCSGNMWGVVAWEKVPGGKDKNNPDVARQSRPTLGMPILIDMKKKPGVDAWEGQVYNAKDGQLYSSTIKPVGTDQLEIQGCVLGFLCGGETWTRVGRRFPQALPTAWPRARPKGPGRRGGAQDCHLDDRSSGSCTGYAEDHRVRSTGACAEGRARPRSEAGGWPAGQPR